MTWADVNTPWPGEPAECTCTRMVVPAIEETLGCPLPWRYAPGTGWLHALPAKRVAA